MPFTPTHILAVLPVASIRRLPLPFSALVIGSMIPDFPLFVPLLPRTSYSISHSLTGIFTEDLLAGLTCFVVFPLLNRPLFALLPAAIQRRCVSLLDGHSVTLHDVWKRSAAKPLLWASLAIVIGASSHVLWDSFTHEGRWGTRLVPRARRDGLDPPRSGHPRIQAPAIRQHPDRPPLPRAPAGKMAVATCGREGSMRA